jgi:hypothetical protein
LHSKSCMFNPPSSMLLIIVVYLTLGVLLFHMNCVISSLYQFLTQFSFSIHNPRDSSFEKRRMFATSTFPFKVNLQRHHCLDRFSILLILSLKLSSIHFFFS